MPPKKKYSRQGVEAAVRLAEQCTEDETLWSTIEANYGAMMKAKGGEELVNLNKFCEQDLIESMASNNHISKEDLMKVVDWKFRKGKPRYALMNQLKVNTDKQVKTHTKQGFEFADEGDAKEAIKEVSRLRGVGPATASAILSIYKPEMFAFMADEVIECLYKGKRGYTASIYHAVNDRCTELAGSLGDGWNPRKVSRALWTAARMSAEGEKDLTLLDSGPDEVDDKKQESTETVTRPTKRQRRQPKR